MYIKYRTKAYITQCGEAALKTAPKGSQLIIEEIYAGYWEWSIGKREPDDSEIIYKSLITDLYR